MAMYGGGAGNTAAVMTLVDCAVVDNSASNEGGGIFMASGGPQELKDCIISKNTAGAGGGVSCEYGDDAALMNCTIAENSALSFAGGGLRFRKSKQPVLSDCTVISNSAPFGGGIDCWQGGNPMLINCMIAQNAAMAWGGAVSCEYGSSPRFIDCVIAENTAMDAGGAVACEINCQPMLMGCTVAANAAANGAAIACIFDGGDPSTVTISNSILWNGEDQIWSDDGSTFDLSYDDVQGGWEGEGNICADPLFIDPDGGDYRLGSGSPCIDAGDNTAVPADEFDLDGDGDTDEPLPLDLDGNPRFVDDPATEDTGYGEAPIVDMGAYEYQAPACPADVTGDGVVDVLDLIEVLDAWGESGGPADVTGDGIVDVLDLIEVLYGWGACP